MFPSIVFATHVTAEVRGFRVGLIDTGISLRDSRFRPHLVSCGEACIYGYDFVDQDTYPNGTRSAHGDRMLEAYLLQLQQLAYTWGFPYGTIEVFPYRVLSEEVGARVPMDLLVDALFRAAQDDVDVVLVSVTGPFSRQDPRFLLLEQVYRDQDILLLTAAGNSATSIAPFPSTLPHALSFGVVVGDPLGLTYSNFGFPDAYIHESSLLGRQGTSYAVPYVGALATLAFFHGAFEGQYDFSWLFSSALTEEFVGEVGIPLFDEARFFRRLSYLFPYLSFSS